MKDVIELMQANFADLRDRLNKLDDKIDNLVSKEDCKNNRNVCANIQQQKISIKKIGVISGAIGLVLTNVIALVKIFYG